MPLSVGDKLGTFEILAPIGAGGMGEVYRARDTKLKRDVALKVLPEPFARDPVRMARFQREAEVLASLNHPNIAQIFGVEEGTLVMEMVNGETLKGPLPLETALNYANQIAQAMEAAHEKGITHRDLKPANILVTPAGVVKVLDFGLAAVSQDSSSAGDPTNSPTMTLAATQAGMIIGTAAYMSPEQAAGKPVDKRADIWSFGVVLWETLTGRQLFNGETVSHTLADVLRGPIDFDQIPKETPRAISNLVKRCLVRDVKKRLRDIGEARIVIEEAIAKPESVQEVSAQAPAPRQPLPVWRRVMPWGAAFVLALALGGVSLWMATRPKPRPASPLRLSVELGADASLDTTLGPAAVLSPDGAVLAFIARLSTGGPSQLFIRQLDHTQASPLADTENAQSPFFSPDGQWIGFFVQDKLKKISIAGGASVTLCDASQPRGGDWGEDGNIIFAPGTATGLFRVSQAGGPPVELTKLDLSAGEVTHRWPQVLPGGKAVLFTAHDANTNFDYANIVVQSLANGQHKILVRGGTYGHYLPSGHLVYLANGTLFAAPFDLDRLEMIGTPVPAIEGVGDDSDHGAAEISFSAGGALLYIPRERSGSMVSILWMDRDGKTEPLRNARGQYGEIHLSPDGRRLALTLFDPKGQDIWVDEWQRDTMSRLTSGNGHNYGPVWTSDGLRIAFASTRAAKGGTANIFWQRADGTGEVKRLTESNNSQIAGSWQPGGKFLAFVERTPQTDWDIMILPMEGSESTGWKPGKPFAFLNSPSKEFEPAFSPDGRWLAYMCDESGAMEVYVRPFPGPGGKWQISTNGGGYPTWSPNRKDLFFLERDGTIMVASYTATPSEFLAEKPRAWTAVRLPISGRGRSFDTGLDAKRLVVLKNPESQPEFKEDKVTFFLNFTDELRRLPAGK